MLLRFCHSHNTINQIKNLASSQTAPMGTLYSDWSDRGGESEHLSLVYNDHGGDGSDYIS